MIDRNITKNGGNIVITVSGVDGKNKVYTLYTNVIKDNDTNVKDDVDLAVDSKKKSSFIPIFIGIIILLLLINVVRIIKNSKKK